MHSSLVTICCSLLLLTGPSRLVASDASPAVVEVPPGFQFEPAWREPADCGPLALFALMKLEGYEVTLGEVKACFHLDAKRGCSFEDIRRAAERLGMACAIRYVNYRDVKHVPAPFILHGISSPAENIGHFTPVLGYETSGDTYHWIDTESLRIRKNPAASVLNGYTGYILIPLDGRARLGQAMRYGSLIVGLGAILFVVTLALRKQLAHRQKGY